MIPNIWD